MFKHLILVSSFVLLCFSCSSSTNKAKQSANNNNMLYMIVGSYAPEDSKGIYVYRFNTETGDMEQVSDVSGIANPTYLVVSNDEKYVYSVAENGKNEAAVYAYAFDKKTGSLRFLNKQQTDGDGPCYINTDKGGHFVVTANYSGGSISVFPLNKDGSLLPVSQLFKYSDVGRVSHLHTIALSPDEKYLFATDLGQDKIYKFTVHPDGGGTGQFLQPSDPIEIQLEAGSGPRHLAFHPNGKYLYCINELSGRTTVFKYTAGNLEAIQYITSDTTTYVTRNRGSADIHTTPDGRFLYTSNRGKANTITSYSINSTDGTIAPVDYQPTGMHPRNFIITPNGKFLLIASRDSNSVHLYEIDQTTGRLKDTGKEEQVSKPVCLKFIKMAE